MPAEGVSMINKKQTNKLVSFLTAITLILLTFPLVLQANEAYATADALTSVYYLTDNPKAESFYQGALKNRIIEYEDMTGVAIDEDDVTFLYSQGEYLWSVFEFENNAEMLYNMQDTFFIFEWTAYPDFIFTPQGDNPFEEVEYVFSRLKNNNCKIMLITNTTEYRYQRYAGFLQYVDICIDEDMVFDIMYDFTDDLREIGFQNLNVMLDARFSDWRIYKAYIINYLRFIKDVSAVTGSDEEFLNECGVQLYVEENGYIKRVNDGETYAKTYEGGEALIESFNDMPVYAVGSNKEWADYTAMEWYLFIKDVVVEALNYDVEVRLLMESNFFYGEETYLLGCTTAHRAAKQDEITGAFMNVDDTLLPLYDVYPDMLAINTYKCLQNTGDGDVARPGSGEDLSWCSIFYDEDQGLFYGYPIA